MWKATDSSGSGNSALERTESAIRSRCGPTAGTSPGGSQSSMSGKLTLLDPAEQPTTRIIRRVTRRRPNLDSGPGVNSALDVAPGAQPPVLGTVFTSESGGSHRSLHVHRTVAFLIPE